MKSLKFFIAAVIYTTVITTSPSAQTQAKQKLSGIKEIEETALLNNLDYKSAVLETLKAYNDLETSVKLDESSISLSGTYSKKTYSDETGYITAVTLPVFEKLSLGASVDEDFTRTFGINIKPLEKSGSVEQTNLTYRTKLAYAEETADNITDNAVESYLDWISASKNHAVLKQITEVKKTLYIDEKIRFEKGESVLDDVRDAFTAWSDSRTDSNNAYTDLQSAEEELYSVLNIDSEKYSVEYPRKDELADLISKLKMKTDKESLTAEKSYNILEAGNYAESIKLELENTSVFEPQLDIGGAYTVSDDEDPVLSVTAILTIGIDSWKSSDIKELKTELDISRQQVLRVAAKEKFSLKQALTNEETAEINYKTAEVELEQAKELFNEASFLNKLGEYSEAELKETELLYKQAEIDFFTAEADHYTALRVLEDYSN